MFFPNDGGGYILDTESSEKAIGADLFQFQDGKERVVGYGKERVVGYGSFVLIATQTNYCVIRKELSAIGVFTKHFRYYLLGNKFKVRTDHNSWIRLMRFKNIEGHLVMWVKELQNYDMEILYRAGRDHADRMSPLPDMHYVEGMKRE